LCCGQRNNATYVMIPFEDSTTSRSCPLGTTMAQSATRRIRSSTRPTNPARIPAGRNDQNGAEAGYGERPDSDRAIDGGAKWHDRIHGVYTDEFLTCDDWRRIAEQFMMLSRNVIVQSSLLLRFHFVCRNESAAADSCQRPVGQPIRQDFGPLASYQPPRRLTDRTSSQPPTRRV
jgi:hypothetical protein